MFPAASVPPESSIIAALQAENLALKGQLEQLQAQVDWFKRQLFGEKSEKRHLLDTQSQADLLASLGKESAESTPPATEMVSYERRKSGKSRDGAVTDAGLRFDDTVPVETIELPLPPESAAIPEEERVVIGEKVTHRLAQRPGSYVILKYVRPVIQSLLVTCRLQGIDPYLYLVDVLQRVSQHPAKDVIELTPRIWKNRFGDNPLTSDLASVNNALN